MVVTLPNIVAYSSAVIETFLYLIILQTKLASVSLSCKSRRFKSKYHNSIIKFNAQKLACHIYTSKQPVINEALRTTVTFMKFYITEKNSIAGSTL